MFSEGERSASWPHRFTLHGMSPLDGPRVSLDKMVKSKCLTLPGLKLQPPSHPGPQPVATPTVLPHINTVE
jgi:hypothetical protein